MIHLTCSVIVFVKVADCEKSFLSAQHMKVKDVKYWLCAVLCIHTICIFICDMVQNVLKAKTNCHVSNILLGCFIAYLTKIYEKIGKIKGEKQ